MEKEIFVIQLLIFAILAQLTPNANKATLVCMRSVTDITAVNVNRYPESAKSARIPLMELKIIVQARTRQSALNAKITIIAMADKMGKQSAI